ncbi:MAG: hypothetical protein U0232_03165 [Thermomicrobiales bacterium]
MWQAILSRPCASAASPSSSARPRRLDGLTLAYGAGSGAEARLAQAAIARTMPFRGDPVAVETPEGLRHLAHGRAAAPACDLGRARRSL